MCHRQASHWGDYIQPAQPHRYTIVSVGVHTTAHRACWVWNAAVAIIRYPGYGIEDALILNRVIAAEFLSMYL